MRLEDKSTDELEYLTTVFCSSDESVDAVRNVLESVFERYQWYYQSASERDYKNIDKSSTSAINTVVELLKAAGQNSLADNVADALYNDRDTSTLTKDKVLFQVKNHMKKLLLERGMTFSVYKNNFAKQMEKTFIEWCETYPLDEAPVHFDNEFEPTPVLGHISGPMTPSA